MKTLLEGVTVGGRKLSDQEQILNLAESAKFLVDLVQRRQFSVDKSTFCSLQGLVARHEALERGHFRGEGAESRFTPDVALGERGRFTPLPTEPGAPQLNKVFEAGAGLLQREVSNPFERGAAFFLFGALQQFFFDGNKRTSRSMMNGILMSEGIDAISIPAIRAREFNERMVDFYTTRNATDMMAFVVDCHPEIGEIRHLNPGLSVVRDMPNISYHSLSESRSAAHSVAGSDESVVESAGLGHTLSNAEVKQRAAERWRRDYQDKFVNVHAHGATPSADKEHSKEEKHRDLDLDHDLDF